MDLRIYNYRVVDAYDEFGIPYLKLCGYCESFWCQLIQHDPQKRVLILRVDQLLRHWHPFRYGNVVLIDDDAVEGVWWSWFQWNGDEGD